MRYSEEQMKAVYAEGFGAGGAFAILHVQGERTLPGSIMTAYEAYKATIKEETCEWKPTGYIAGEEFHTACGKTGFREGGDYCNWCGKRVEVES